MSLRMLRTGVVYNGDDPYCKHGSGGELHGLFDVSCVGHDRRHYRCGACGGRSVGPLTRHGRPVPLTAAEEAWLLGGPSDLPPLPDRPRRRPVYVPLWVVLVDTLKRAWGRL